MHMMTHPCINHDRFNYNPTTRTFSAEDSDFKEYTTMQRGFWIKGKKRTMFFTHSWTQYTNTYGNSVDAPELVAWHYINEETNTTATLFND